MEQRLRRLCVDVLVAGGLSAVLVAYAWFYIWLFRRAPNAALATGAVQIVAIVVTIALGVRRARRRVASTADRWVDASTEAPAPLHLAVVPARRAAEEASPVGVHGA